LCGIAAVWNVEDAYSTLHDILLGLQHRGQESVGVVLKDFKTVKGGGLVDTVLGEDRWTKSTSGIGHVRYSTVGATDEIQPFVAITQKGKIAVAHNGTIPNVEELFSSLLKRGAVFQSSVDSEVFLHLASMAPHEDPKISIMWALSRISAAYALVWMHPDFIAVARDPYGFRPVFLGEFQTGYVAASEDSALKAIGAQKIEEVEPGTVFFLTTDGLEKKRFDKEKPKRFCSFEYIYFARPDSSFSGLNVHKARFMMGVELYRENPVDAELVVPVLDSGLSGALGFSRESGIPLGLGLMKNRYVGRSFIMPSGRKEIVRKKLVPIIEVVKGKKVVVIDDSIVRGTTMGIIVQILKEAGAKEVHVGIHSPPITYPCYYGIDTAKKRELVASQLDVEEIRREVQADSLFYLSIEGLIKILGGNGVCVACFTGTYPHVDL